ncbi:MAG: hypothetical protein ACFE0P_08850 [Oceanicaulis sp.]
MVLAIWIFIVFVYLKVVTELFYYDGMNVFGCAILAIFVGGAIFLAAGGYAGEFGRFVVRSRYEGAKPEEFLARSLVVLVSALVTSYVIGRFIIFGFDENFHDEIVLIETSWRRSELNLGGLGFVFVFGVPLIAHWLTVLFPVLDATSRRTHGGPDERS